MTRVLFGAIIAIGVLIILGSTLAPALGFSLDRGGPSDPSHGISLSPNEKELYVIDWPNSYVHVFDVSGVPRVAPRQVANIKLSRSMNHQESPCAYDCLADGWLQHSRDGRFLYVGDAGDVIDTRTRKVLTNLPALYNSRKHLEIDWQNGVPVSTTSRHGLGYRGVVPLPPQRGSVKGPGTVQRREYVFPDGAIYVYDMDHGQKLVKTISLPQVKGTRGVVASPATHMLYISFGSDAGSGGSLLKYDLIKNRVVWTRVYSHGIDSMAITPNGKSIYMPDGELSSDGKWYVVNAKTGRETAAVIDTGVGTGDNGPHNTVVSLNGRHVYMGDRNLDHAGANYLYVADTRTNRIVKRIGPFKSGIRPFTINGRESLVYTSVTGFLGFQVGDITTGRVLYTVPIRGFQAANFGTNNVIAACIGVTVLLSGLWGMMRRTG